MAVPFDHGLPDQLRPHPFAGARPPVARSLNFGRKAGVRGRPIIG
jgi:hypothetical protein